MRAVLSIGLLISMALLSKPSLSMEDHGSESVRRVIELWLNIPLQTLDLLGFDDISKEFLKHARVSQYDWDDFSDQVPAGWKGWKRQGFPWESVVGVGIVGRPVERERESIIGTDLVASLSVQTNKGRGLAFLRRIDVEPRMGQIQYTSAMGSPSFLQGALMQMRKYPYELDLKSHAKYLNGTIRTWFVSSSLDDLAALSFVEHRLSLNERFVGSTWHLRQNIPSDERLSQEKQEMQTHSRTDPVKAFVRANYRARPFHVLKPHAGAQPEPHFWGQREIRIVPAD